MKEETFRKLKLQQAGLKLSGEVYGDDLAPVSVDVYLDDKSHRVFQLDKRLRRYRYADSKVAGAPFCPWKPLD